MLVGEPFNILQNTDQSQLPWGLGRSPTMWKQGGKLPIFIDGAKLFTQAYTEILFAQS